MGAPGLRRGTTEYVWPTGLVRPGDVRLVYLDLNHWIELAKAAVGHADGARYVAALEVIREAKASGLYVFPLSSTHFMEVTATKNRRHRADVATVMEELSGFVTLISRSVIMEMEIDAALDEFGKPLGLPYPPISLLRHTVAHAFGKVGGFKVMHPDKGDITEEVRAAWPASEEEFDRWQAEAERELARRVLRGPTTDEEEASLRADGWDPTVVRRLMIDNANFHAEQAASFAALPYWRGDRGRDVVSLRHLALELNEVLFKRLAVRGLELEGVVGDPESSRRFVDAMPTSDVTVSLMAAAHRNPQTVWDVNRMFDMDALAVAVPYCDFVATDREAAHALHTERVPARLETTVVATLDELVDALG